MPSAKKMFDETMERARRLLVAHDQLKAGTRESADVVRAALVLGVSAFDAYFTAKFVNLAVPYLKNHPPGDDFLKLLEKAGLDTAAALELIQMDRPYRRVRTLIDHHLAEYTTQRFNRIDELFVCIGRPSFSEDVESRAGRKTLKASIKKAVERRHDIAHEGDLNAHGKLKKIRREWVETRLDDISLFVDACEEILPED